MKVENQLLKAHLHDMPCCLHVSGEDAYSFLQSQFSNDLPKDEETFARYGLWLNVKGRVLADSFIISYEYEDFYIFSENSKASFIKEILDAHIIADDVTIEPIQLKGSIFVNLPAANLLSLELGLFKEEAEQIRFNHINSNLGTVTLFPRKRLDEDGYVFCFTDIKTYYLCKKVLDKGSVHWISENEMHLNRLTFGMPLVPDEIGPNDLAGEGDLVPSAVSLTKGCYLGQEVVARLFHLGKPQRQLFIMTFNEFNKRESIQLPLNITVGNHSLGELKTLYHDTNELNRWYGVALLKVRYLEKVQSEFRLADHSVDSLCRLPEFSLSHI